MMIASTKTIFVSAVIVAVLSLALSSVQSEGGTPTATDSSLIRRGFYRRTCPRVEIIVRESVAKYISKAPSLAASLLRMHFHDCFVRGCDGSILLNSTGSSKKSEKDAFPNLSLRGYQVIDAAKEEVEKQCPGVVSCADILTLAARDAVHMLGGPVWRVPTGRRDGVVSFQNEVLANLPPPFANFQQLKSSFASKGLNVKDLVVLSGAHTIGNSHCTSFDNRIYNFTGKGDMYPSLDTFYAQKLRTKCNPGDRSSIVEMDPGSFRTFDNHYYLNLNKKRGLFQSDAALLTDPFANSLINSLLAQGSTPFFFDFATSMEKMGRIGVLTGNAGEIRRHCARLNSS